MAASRRTARTRGDDQGRSEEAIEESFRCFDQGKRRVYQCQPVLGHDPADGAAATAKKHSVALPALRRRAARRVSGAAAILAGAATVFSELGVRRRRSRTSSRPRGSRAGRSTDVRQQGERDVALYWMGTERPARDLPVVIAEEPHPFRQIARCVDAHPAQRQDFGRLVFVLGVRPGAESPCMPGHRGHSGWSRSSPPSPPRHDHVSTRWVGTPVHRPRGRHRLHARGGRRGRKVSEASFERGATVIPGWPLDPGREGLSPP